MKTRWDHIISIVRKALHSVSMVMERTTAGDGPIPVHPPKAKPLYATPQNHSQFCQNAGTFGPQNLPQNRRFTLNKLNTRISLGLSLYYTVPLAFPSRTGGAMCVSSCYHCRKLVPFWCIYLNIHRNDVCGSLIYIQQPLIDVFHSLHILTCS